MRTFEELAQTLAHKLRPPFGIALGSPREVTELAAGLPSGAVTCWQMDLHQADRLRMELRENGVHADVQCIGDLWDLPTRCQTLLYPVPKGGERELKLDVVEQAYHALVPQGTFVVLSPFERDAFFPPVLKKVFGKVHTPMETDNSLFWCTRGEDKPRRRHEVRFHVRVDEETSYSFLSRPGVFSYGRFDDGARALTESMHIGPGERVIDLGCGCGTNGILAARQSGPNGYIAFVESNVRALALADINARALGVAKFETFATSTVSGPTTRSFDVALANPPYFAADAIARLFVDRGREMLRFGGRLLLVSKHFAAMEKLVAEVFGEVEVSERRGYGIFCGVKK